MILKSGNHGTDCRIQEHLSRLQAQHTRFFKESKFEFHMLCSVSSWFRSARFFQVPCKKLVRVLKALQFGMMDGCKTVPAVDEV